MTLYKYINKKYLDDIFIHGRIKIGTLYEYRKEEELGLIVGDKEEGQHNTTLGGDEALEIDLGQNTLEAEYFRNHVLRPDQRHSKVKIIMEKGAKLIANTNSPNYYIFCMTSKYSEEVMKEFECDACIEIFNPEHFFKIISRVIRHKATFDGAYEITYGNKTTDHLNPHTVHPAILKDERYINQEEVRAIWVPKKEPKGSLFVKS